MNAAAALSPGFYPDVPMSRYLALDAMGAGRLDWLSVSPRYYRWKLSQPPDETDATALGTALHMAVLQPDLFDRTYALEPDPWRVAPPGSVKPRATKAYRDACADLEASGRVVMRRDAWDATRYMAQSIHEHPFASALLAKAPQREVTMVWERDGRLCRGRLDAGGAGVIGDIKTTRALADFSPWVLSRERYYLGAAWYVDGRARLGQSTEHFYHLAVENVAPYDCGVFALDGPSLELGRSEIERLLAKLDECERSGEWPGMFPTVETGTLSNATFERLSQMEAA